MLNSFPFAVIPSTSRSTPELELTLEKLKAVSEGERSIKFLLTNELLHRFGLLDSSRSVVARSTLPAPGPETEIRQVPASTIEPTSSEPLEETVLKKCSGHAEETGPSERVPLSPIGEEENTPQRPGKEPAELEEKTGEEPVTAEGEVNVQEVEAEVQHTGHESDDSHIFSNLSDFMGTPSDFYASQATLSGLELSPNVPLPPPAKDISSTTQAVTILTSQSGL